MRERIGKIAAIAVLALGLGLQAGQASANFYNDACQTIRLHGKWQEVPGLNKETPLELTLAYQLNFQRHPEFLKINLPMGQSEFQISIVGFRDREAGEIFLPQIFWYPREVRFQYYVRSADGRWMSETRTSTYKPAATKVEDTAECDPDLFLEPLTPRKIR